MTVIAFPPSLLLGVPFAIYTVLMFVVHETNTATSFDDGVFDFKYVRVMISDILTPSSKYYIRHKSTELFI